MIKNILNIIKNIKSGKYSKRISVIIPAYNVEKYIDRCLESVRNQTYKNLEIICINDGSIDSTLQKLQQHAKEDKRIIIIDNEHLGVAATRNIGLKTATGEYIGFVDSDDSIDPKMYETLYKILENEDTDLAVCGYERIYEDFSHRKDSDEFYDKQSRFPAGKNYISNEILSCFMITLWTKLYKQSIIKEFNISFENGLIFEDWVFFWEYLTHSKSLYFLEDKLYFYYQHENSIMASIYEKPDGGADSTLDYMQTAEVIYKNLRKNNIFDKYQKAFWRTYAHIYKNAYYFINDAKKQAVKDKALNFLEALEINKRKNYMSLEDYTYLLEILN